MATTYSRGYRGWVLFLLLLTYMSSYIDRSILGILAEPIKHELGLSDGQLGLLSGLSFALFYTVLGLPIARLAERYSRSMIISASLVVWSGMTALCGVTVSYAQLLLCRIGVGVGEAGGNPAAHSLITDIFPPERRASALAIYSLGVPLGSLIGAVAGGALAQAWGWRAAFLVVGPPGILLAILVLLTIREPQRGGADIARGDAPADAVPPLTAVLRMLFGNPAFIHLAAGAALVVFTGYSIALFMAPFFIREFGLGIADVGWISGAVNGFAAAAGIAIGGFITDWAGKRDRRYYAWLPASCVGLAGPLFALAFLQQSWQAAMLLLIPATTLIYTYFAPTFAVMHNMVEPRMRATAASVLFLIINLVGMGLGPPIVGAASDAFAARAFTGDAAAASATGMRYALAGCGLICLWAAAHFARAGSKLGR
jgi:predicted MFS family arabinose efflux permease